MDDLDSLQQEWIDLYRRLCCTPGMEKEISAPFLSVRAKEPRAILYVGKATNGWMEGEGWFRPGELNAEGSRRYSCKFLGGVESAAHPSARNSAFLRFAARLNEAANEKWGATREYRLGHISWTNLCKIGLRSGKTPSGQAYKAQEDLAIRTLRQEIASYKPELVYFATHNDAVEILQGVIPDERGDTWTRTDKTFWWRSAKDELPILVWSDHPERKRNELLDRWLAEVSHLFPE
jgi:hypothetical protein